MDISYHGNKTGFPRPGYINTNKHTAKKETQTLAVTYSCMHTHACPCKQNVHMHLHTHPRMQARTRTHYDTVTPEVQNQLYILASCISLSRLSLTFIMY